MQAEALFDILIGYIAEQTSTIRIGSVELQPYGNAR
jgi:hypothetical protein